MNLNQVRFAILVFFAATVCRGEAGSAIRLPNANTSLAVPAMAAGDGVVYVVYRSFDWLQFSEQLQVLAYDFGSRKELRHATIPIPKVHGPRASDGLALSKDGRMLAYVEAREPYLVLLLSAGDLSEIRRSNVLPFSAQDHQRMFAGFDGEQLALASNMYQYGKPEINGLRFIRLGASDLKPVSDAKVPGITQETSGRIIWLPGAKTTWVNPPSRLGSDQWRQYTEAGQKTGQELEHRNGLSEGAIALGDERLLAFYGKYADGSVVSYDDHRSVELKLPCSPHPYGMSNDPGYAGTICTTQRDILPEAGGDRIVTSEFLLLRTDGPTVVWRQKMNWVDVSDGHGLDGGYQKADPLIYRYGKKVWVVALSKPTALTIYEIDIPQ